jgi:hypothetical protein
MKTNLIDTMVHNVLNEEFYKKTNSIYEAEMKKNIDEKLVGKQSKIDKNKNGKIDSEDFKLLKKNKNKKKSSVKMTEEELITFIENIVLESSDSTRSPKTLANLKTLNSKNKKENDSYISSVGKKMNDYMKTGSAGKYNTTPGEFPRTNGQIKKSETKAFRLDDAENEYVDNLGRGPGMENLVYDEIDPNEEWLTDTIEGSSRTGNSPEWANTGQSDVNKNVNTRRKNNYYGAEKKRAYQKSQDVHVVNDDNPRPDFITKMSQASKSKKNESVLKTNKIMTEEFIKMNKLINYNKITQ